MSNHWKGANHWGVPTPNRLALRAAPRRATLSLLVTGYSFSPEYFILGGKCGYAMVYRNGDP